MTDILAIHGGSRVRERDFGYLAPIGDEEIHAAIAVLREKKLSGFYQDFLGGERVQQFECAFAEYIGVTHAIAFNAGTSALHAALSAADIGQGDEVIVPPFTFTATAAAVRMVGAIPVFVDIAPDTFCMNPDLVRRALTPRTKAILPVHLYGKVAALDALQDIAATHRLTLIEDACQAPGCTFRGARVGSVGAMGCFSFVETKNIVIGEGGMVTTNDARLAERCRLIRNHGEAWVRGRPREYWSTMLGYNFRPTELAAAIGIEQVKKLDALNAIRQRNAAWLTDAFRAVPGMHPIAFHDGEICHVFPLRYDAAVGGIPRADIVAMVQAEGIPLSVGYPQPLTKLPLFDGCPGSTECPEAERLCMELICFPRVHTPYGIDDMRDVVTAFQKVFAHARAVV